MSAPVLVRSVGDVVSNIRTYQSEVAESGRLKESLALAQWIYAMRDQSGQWIFGPSKFVGYAHMNAERYATFYGSGMDGGKTEKILSKLFETVDPEAPLYAELTGARDRFLARIGVRMGEKFQGFRVAPGDAEPQQRMSDDALLSRIVSDPGICGGRPRIRGTRLRVVDILEMLAGGMSHDEILQDFPDIVRDDLFAALAYAARAVDHAILRAA